MSEEKTAVTLAYDAMRFQLRDAEDDEDREIYTVVCEAMEAQMPRWEVYDDPLTYLKDAISTKSKQDRLELPSGDAEDLLLYFLGFAHGLLQGVPLRKLTGGEDRQLYFFLLDMLGLNEND